MIIFFKKRSPYILSLLFRIGKECPKLATKISARPAITIHTTVDLPTRPGPILFNLSNQTISGVFSAEEGVLVEETAWQDCYRNDHWGVQCDIRIIPTVDTTSNLAKPCVGYLVTGPQWGASVPQIPWAMAPAL